MTIWKILLATLVGLALIMILIAVVVSRAERTSKAIDALGNYLEDSEASPEGKKMIDVMRESLESKSYEQLSIIQVQTDDEACDVNPCDGRLYKVLAGAVLTARDKQQAESSARTTIIVSICSSILAAISFLFSSIVTIVTLRSRSKTG